MWYNSAVRWRQMLSTKRHRAIRVQKTLNMYSDRQPLAGSNLRSLRAIELSYLHMPGHIFQTDLRELTIVRIPFLIYPPGNWVMQLNFTSPSLDGPPLSQFGADLRHFSRSFSMKRLTHLVVVLRLRTSIPHPSAYSFTAISPFSPLSGPFLSRAWIAPFAVDNHTSLTSKTSAVEWEVWAWLNWLLAPQPTAILTVFTFHAAMSASRTETGYFLRRSAPCVALYIQLVLLLRQLIPSPCFNSGMIRTIALVALCP
ncbi:hypothetical protein C8J57DRAFT_1313929 [Mycena rebaudengoi]|nr:hypothetical protein C8J57DRAFT_1313929 [Mycena rebaudengoi]